VKWTATLRASEPLRQLCDAKAQRDFWKLIDRPQPDLPATRAVGLDVRIALGGEFLDGGVKRAHDKLICGLSAKPKQRCRFKDVE
jgi:hypothetical protein